MTYRLQLDASGNEIDMTETDAGNTADPEAIHGITFADTSKRRMTLDQDNDPEAALMQAEVDNLAQRMKQAEAFAVSPEVFNQSTGLPHKGCEAGVARRVRVANELREQAEYALQTGNMTLHGRNGAPPSDPAVADMREQLKAQEAAREADRLAKIARRA